jgi:hypothetical protein
LRREEDRYWRKEFRREGKNTARAVPPSVNQDNGTFGGFE